MRVKSTMLVKVAELNVNRFVRKELDTDHVLFLAGLIESRVELPKIEITEDLSVVDGRHRKEAYDLNSITEVEAKVLVFDTTAELIGYAYRANSGGPKPPTPGDTEHTIELLLVEGLNNKAIATHLGLPSGMIRQYVENVKSRLNRAKLQRAVDAVVDGGLTAAKAAVEHDVDVEKLKEALSGSRAKHKKSKNGIDELQRKFTVTYRSVGQVQANAMRRILEKYDDGDVNAKQVQEVIAHLKSLQRKASRSVADWERRFEAKSSEKNGSQPVEDVAAAG